MDKQSRQVEDLSAVFLKINGRGYATEAAKAGYRAKCLNVNTEGRTRRDAASPALNFYRSIMYHRKNKLRQKCNCHDDGRHFGAVYHWEHCEYVRWLAQKKKERGAQDRRLTTKSAARHVMNPVE